MAGVRPNHQPIGGSDPNHQGVFITAVPVTKRTSERGGEGYCVKEGGGEEGKRERERAGEVRLYYSLG